MNGVEGQEVSGGVLYAPATLEVIVLAREYCARLTDRDVVSGVVILEWLYSFWPLLFYKVTRMPRVLLEESHVHLGTGLTEGEYESLRLHLAELFASHDVVGLLLSEDDFELVGPEPTLSELAADIYQVLYDLLFHYRDGAEERMVSALSDFQFYFYESWGDKLLLALRELQQRAAHSDGMHSEDSYE